MSVKQHRDEKIRRRRENQSFVSDVVSGALWHTHEIADSSETWASVSDVTKAFRFSINRHENQSMCVCMTAQRTSSRPKNENETLGGAEETRRRRRRRMRVMTFRTKCQFRLADVAGPVGGGGFVFWGRRNERV